MKIFCMRCGAPMEVEPAALQAVLTCGACGNQFRAQPGPQAGPSGSAAAGAVGIVAVLVIGGMVVVAVIGILAAIAIPNFIRFQSRSKQSECKAQLKSLYTAQRASHAELGEFSADLQKLGFMPERGNRYAYFIAPGKTLAPAGGPVPPGAVGFQVDVARYPGVRAEGGELPRTFAGGLTLGVTGTCPDCTFTGACAGNIDGDATVDVWSVSTRERTAGTGEPIPAGVPFNDVSDLTN